MKLVADLPDYEKRRWKIVRMDNFTDVPGAIVAADEETGQCVMMEMEESKMLSFGPRGIRIVGAGR